MVSHDFIGLLVLGLFNVSIGRQHIRTDLSYDAIVSNLMLQLCIAAVPYNSALPRLESSNVYHRDSQYTTCVHGFCRLQGACWQSQRHENHRIAVGTALRFKVDR